MTRIRVLEPDRLRKVDTTGYPSFSADDPRDGAAAPGVARRLPPAARAELLYLLLLPDCDRAARIGEFWPSPRTRSFGEVLIDLEEHRYARAVVVGMLREAERRG
jgi:hypothetical protein